MQPEHSEIRDEQWVRDRFGEVGEPPSNDITVDPDVDEAPNTEHPR